MKYTFTGGPRGPPYFYRREDGKTHFKLQFRKDSIATALLALQHGEPLDELVYCEVMFSEKIRRAARTQPIYPRNSNPVFLNSAASRHGFALRKDLSILLYHVVTRGKTKGDAFGIPSEWALYNSAGLQAAADQGISEGIAPDTVQYIGIAADEPSDWHD